MSESLRLRPRRDGSNWNQGWLILRRMRGASHAGRLRHEHLVRINDPANTLGAWLTRDQLWAGLRHTVLTPQSLDDSIDAASVRETSPGVLERRIRRGQSISCDSVSFVAGESITIRPDVNGAFAGSHLRIEIEEPVPQMLFVRFTYQLVGLDEGHTEEEDQARRSAYQASDIERVRQARRYAARLAMC